MNVLHRKRSNLIAKRQPKTNKLFFKRIIRSSCSQLFSKIDVLKIRNMHREAPVLECLFNKLGLQLY